MSFIVGILTFVLVVNCAALILLILVQLPKKDAGAGLAFGGGAADALFGAGSGNALTKITKWAAFIFMLLTVFLGSLEVKMHAGNQSLFEQGVEQQQQMQSSPQMKPAAPQPASPSQSGTPSSSAMPLTSAPNTPVTTPATVPVTSTNGK
ncbi:MAG TPA: preprotein translocase subunit SecG [Pseudomonadales bacterium]|nr:preprotein translocase subunit SecG [Pseudomonadales bacterium]